MILKPISAASYHNRSVSIRPVEPRSLSDKRCKTPPFRDGDIRRKLEFYISRDYIKMVRVASPLRQ
jgi:hypothetical protein